MLLLSASWLQIKGKISYSVQGLVAREKDKES